MRRDLRDRLEVAQQELAARIGRVAAAPPAMLLLSRFGFDFLGGEPELERWPAASVGGLAQVPGPGRGQLTLRSIRGQGVLCHEWEELPNETVEPASEAFLVWLAARLGVRITVHLAAGLLLGAPLDRGRIVALRDHLRWDRGDPLQGWPSAREGARFPQLSHLYDRPLLESATRALELHGHPGAGVVALIRRGPSGPTDAELAAFERLGAEIVLEGGSSEAIAARHAGLRFASFSLLLSSAAGREGLDPGTLAERAERTLPDLGRVLCSFVEGVAPEPGGSS